MSGFGTSKRVNHDASDFYARRMFSAANIDGAGSNPENENDLGRYKNSVLCQDSRDLKTTIPDSCVHLMVTSPPYNVGKDYDKDMDMEQYLSLLDGVFSETYRILVDGGRACINIANVGRKPYIPLHAHIIGLMHKNGFAMRGEIIWQKSAGAGTSTAWGSWMSASNPTLRDTHEYILIFSKGRFGRDVKQKTNTIKRDEFLECTKSVWEFAPESAKKVSHPAPFPVELPYRCIQLYTFKDDIVFDPFCGSGSTAIAAIRSKRNFLMIDSSKEYTEIAKKRIANEVAQTRLVG